MVCELKELLAGIEYQGVLPKGVATLVTQDSRKVTENAVFVCVKGRSSDGHLFAEKALQDGASLLVTERPLGLPREIVVKNARQVYALLCRNFFGNPAARLQMVGVTGTNGKSTVTSVLKQALEQLGVSCGLIGTIHTEIGSMEIPAKFTTPEAWDLNALLSRMVQAGCTHVVMEASSQALEQERLFGIQFALGVFLNLSQDHLDYHGTMEEYFEAKKRLFRQADKMLVNLNDEWGQRLLAECECPDKRSFAVETDAANFVARNVQLKAGEVRFAFLSEGFLEPVVFPMPGNYSVENSLAAASAAVMLGQGSAQTAKALAVCKGVKGRCEVLYSKEFTIIRDFAHTADAIDKLLKALKPFAQNRLVVLYGCAGDRDAAKRPAMGEAAAQYGDVLYLTGDNSRTEDPMKTVNDGLEAVKNSGKPYFIELNREKAVEMALDELQSGDMLVLCGKGHEDYQVLNGYTVYLNEKELVERWLFRRGLA